MNKNEFVGTIAPMVVTENENRGNPLFPSVVIAQAILESAWGQSTIMMRANAIFGIKATTSWKGKVYNARTKECYDGYTYTSIYDCFRAYDNLEDSIHDYFDLICGLSRYSKALHTSSPEQCIRAIKDGGYATSPSYVDSVMKLIEQNNLTKYDDIKQENEDVEKEVNINQMAIDTINGRYGNGEDRKKALGELYPEVQARVNQILSSVEKVQNKVESITYEVKKGDTLTKLARKYRTTIKKIASDNNIKNVDLIYVGQKLVIYKGMK